MWALEEEGMKFIYKSDCLEEKFSRIFPIVFHSLGSRFFRFHLAYDTERNRVIVNDPRLWLTVMSWIELTFNCFSRLKNNFNLKIGSFSIFHNSWRPWNISLKDELSRHLIITSKYQQTSILYIFKLTKLAKYPELQFSRSDYTHSLAQMILEELMRLSLLLDWSFINRSFTSTNFLQTCVKLCALVCCISQCLFNSHVGI